ncbi:glycosyltransferase family 4 protein [Streptomyces profundus]|uniref:glycosyltransferase family 4 protein n=1 Tax=Streptomyces profundus TaxID=2867410 RepID=UPI001D163017|nr:glycosyltransferase family 4 protein [Streptomyces sp. MA3_2.13]UED83185.1 glycosyltransferase family 4 protein [Streptomyces sp. MA3_2.13]
MRIDHTSPSPPPQDRSKATGQPRVVVALHEGLFGAASGTGFSNRALLTALVRLLPAGRLSVITPNVPEGAGAFDGGWAGEVRQMLRQAAAEVVTIPKIHAPPDSLRSWAALCDLAGEATARIAADASRCLVIGLDAPLLGLASRAAPTTDLLLIPRSSSALTRPRDLSRVRWEREALRTAPLRGARIGAISSHMLTHLIADCVVPAANIVSIPNGLIPGEMARPAHVPALPHRARAGFLLAMGRAVPAKGFEDLLEALRLLKERGVRLPPLLLAAVTSDRHDHATPYQKDLAALVHAYDLDATLITRFTPAVRAWLHSSALCAVIVPSREEPFGRIPLEAFAAGAGPVVATRAGGLTQTVVEGETGLTAEPGDPKSLASAVHRALTIRTEERERLRRNGMSLVRSRHDYQANVRYALGHVAPWAMAPSPTTEGAER